MIQLPIGGQLYGLVPRTFLNKFKYCKTLWLSKSEKTKFMFFQAKMGISNYIIYHSYRSDTGLVLQIMEIR